MVAAGDVEEQSSVCLLNGLQLRLFSKPIIFIAEAN